MYNCPLSLALLFMYNFTDINKKTSFRRMAILRESKGPMNGGLLVPVCLIWIKIFVNRSSRPVCY